MNKQIEIKKIQANPNNPRKTFMKIKELSEDIKKNGLIQKILVRPKNKGFEIVHGERRFRALKLLRRDKIDCEVRELTDAQVSNIMLSENIQREDLSVIDLANEFKKRLENMTQTELSKEINKSQPYIVKILKFLELPKCAQSDLSIGLISMEEGRELLRYVKYLKMLDYNEIDIEIGVGAMLDWLFFNVDDKHKLRKIINLNIYEKIRYAFTEHGEKFIFRFNVGEEFEIIKTEKNYGGKHVCELLKFSFYYIMSNCKHKWVDTRYNMDTGEDIEEEEYCDICGMLKTNLEVVKKLI